MYSRTLFRISLFASISFAFKENPLNRKTQQYQQSYMQLLILIPALFFVGIFCCTETSAQNLNGDNITLASSFPFVRLLDDAGTTAEWMIKANAFDFRINEMQNDAMITPFLIEPGARIVSIIIDETGRIGLGDFSPDGILDIEALPGTFGDITFNPGVANESSMAVLEVNKAAELFVRTTRVGRSSLVTLAAPNVEFSLLANSNGGTAKFMLRDMINGKNALTVFPSAENNNTLTIRNNRVGIGFANPQHPLQMQSGAHCTAGGVFTNACSRELKTGIARLDEAAALQAFEKLQPVTYRYKAEPQESHVGFIAEDVPDLLATKDRKGLAALDVTALLTKVVQSQHATIAEQKTEIKLLQKGFADQAEMIEALATELETLRNRLEQK